MEAETGGQRPGVAVEADVHRLSEGRLLPDGKEPPEGDSRGRMLPMRTDGPPGCRDSSPDV